MDFFFGTMTEVSIYFGLTELHLCQNYALCFTELHIIA